MPLILQLTPGQQIEYARIADELNALGFETEPFGNRTIAVKAAPAAVGPADLEKVLCEILETAEAELRGVSLDDLRRVDRGIHRLPRGHQDQHAAGSRQDGMAAARAGGHRLPDELSARAADRAAILHAGDSEGISPHLTREDPGGRLRQVCDTGPRHVRAAAARDSPGRSRPCGSPRRRRHPRRASGRRP